MPEDNVVESPKTKHEFEVRPKAKHPSFYSREQADAQNVHDAVDGSPNVTSEQLGIGAVNNPASDRIPADQMVEASKAQSLKAGKPWCTTKLGLADEFNTAGHVYRGEALGPDTTTQGKTVNE